MAKYEPKTRETDASVEDFLNSVDNKERRDDGFRLLEMFKRITKQKPNIGPGVKERMQFASTVTRAQADASREIVNKARDHIRQIAIPGTVLALPTAPSIAPKIALSGAELEEFRTRVMRLTCTSGISGLPQMNIPGGTITGCPIGLSFIGWAGGDEALLDLACELSRHCGMAA